MQSEDKIIIRGLRQNNLKNVSLDIPKGKIVVFTGVSGSGKSSIVFDTIAAESQRQMNETYTAFMRGRLPKYEKPKVERIDNLSASVIVDQSRLGGNARSTVGTISDMYAALRLLYSRIGEPYAGTARFPATIEQEAPLLCAVIPVLFIQIKQTRASVLLPVVVAHFEGGQIQHIFVPGLIRVDGPFNVQIQNLSDAGAGLAHTVGIVEGEVGSCSHIGCSDACVE